LKFSFSLHLIGWAREAFLDQDVTWTPFGGVLDEDWHEFTTDEKSEIKNDESSLKVEVLPGFIWKTAGEGSPPGKARKNAAVQEELFGAESPEPAPKKAKAADPKPEPAQKKQRPLTHVCAQGDCGTCCMRLHAWHVCRCGHVDACGRMQTYDARMWTHVPRMRVVQE
jgi:hypothetical protein